MTDKTNQITQSAFPVKGSTMSDIKKKATINTTRAPNTTECPKH